MSPSLSTALLITMIGMGLVFLAILLLWGVMEVLVRLTAGRRGPASPPEAGRLAAEAPAAEQHRRRQRAAAAAVAVALALRQGTASITAPPKGLSPWQAVQRARLLNRGAAAIQHKPRGNQR